MPHDPELAERIRDALAGTPDLTERKMFGGIGWMIGGHMAVGAHSDGSLMVRADKERSVALVAGEEGAQLMMQRGRPTRGWILVDAAQLSDEDVFQSWIERGRAYASSLPPK